MSDAELQAAAEEGPIDVRPLLCHTQAVERFVKEVTVAASNVVGEGRRDGLIRTKILSRGRLIITYGLWGKEGCSEISTCPSWGWGGRRESYVRSFKTTKMLISGVLTRSNGPVQVSFCHRRPLSAAFSIVARLGAVRLEILMTFVLIRHKLSENPNYFHSVRCFQSSIELRLKVTLCLKTSLAL